MSHGVTEGTELIKAPMIRRFPFSRGRVMAGTTAAAVAPIVGRAVRARKFAPFTAEDAKYVGRRGHAARPYVFIRPRFEDPEF